MMLSNVMFWTLGLEAHQLGDGLGHVRVHADHRLAVRGDELIGRIGRVSGHRQRAARLDVGRDLGDDRRVRLAR